MSSQVSDRSPNICVYRSTAESGSTSTGLVSPAWNALDERQVGVVQVARAPGQDASVECDHKDAVSGRLRPAEEAGGHRLVLWPVQLVPALPGAVRQCDVLDRGRRRRTENHRHTGSRGSPGHGRFTVRMGNTENSDGRQHERNGQVSAEHSRAVRRCTHVSQHPRHDAPPPERIQVLPGGVARAGRAGDVVKGSRRHDRTRCLLQPAEVGRQIRHRAGQAGQVDLVLIALQRTGHGWLTRDRCTEGRLTS
jgi:hypothetical protein